MFEFSHANSGGLLMRRDPYVRDGMGFRFTEPFHSGVIVSQTHSHSSSREKCFSPPLLSSSTVSWIAKKPLI